MFDVQALIKLIDAERLNVFFNGARYQAYSSAPDPAFHVWFQPKLFGGAIITDSSNYVHYIGKEEANELLTAFKGTKRNPAYNISNQLTAMAKEQDAKLIKELDRK